MQPRKPRKVTIRGNPFGAGFYCERCKVSIAYKIAFGTASLAQLGENLPMLPAR